MTCTLLAVMQIVTTLEDNVIAASKAENAHQPMAQQFHLQVGILSRETLIHVLEGTCTKIFTKHCLKY